MDAEKSELIRIKLFGNGKRLVTVFENDQGQRNYQFSRLVNANWGIEWDFKKKDDTEQQHKGELLLNIKNGVVSVLQAKIDGNLVDPPGILEGAMGNNEVRFRGKGLYDVLNELLEASKEGPMKSDSGGGAVPEDGNEEFVVLGDDDGTGESSDDMFGQW